MSKGPCRFLERVFQEKGTTHAKALRWDGKDGAWDVHRTVGRLIFSAETEVC